MGWSRFLSMYRVEQNLFFRSPDVILFNLAMPLVTLILITMIAGNKNAADSGLTYLQSAYVALSTVGICCSAFMSIPIVIVDYRSQGVLRRMYCSPCSPARLLACDTICSGVIAALSTLIPIPRGIHPETALKPAGNTSAGIVAPENSSMGK